jgi:catecholate siderophore receptor
VSATGTKTLTALRDVPQSISVITRELIADQAMRSMADVVRYIPGVVMGQGEGNRDQPTIRGNATTTDFFVDGMRDDAQYFRDLYNVDRVEALKGSNAMVFGRGGGGGVLNRVTKEPRWAPSREVRIQGGSYDNRRVSADVGQVLTPAVAFRVNGVYENSATFRERAALERSGINPALAFASPSRTTQVALGYEFFRDHRTADRGIPSFGGRPLDIDPATFFGDPSASYADMNVHAATATATHTTASGLTIRNRARLTSYDKSYDNVFPGAVNTAGDQVSLSAYGTATQRRNLLNQLDLLFDATTGSLRHTVLVGAELGRQVTDNFRRTGYFGDSVTSVSAPLSEPTISLPLVFRQSPTDADNHVTGGIRSLYVQDQIALSRHWQLIAGIRFEEFDVRYRDNRTNSILRRDDRMISPRAGLVFKPADDVSLYSSYSVSHLPSAGDQFSSLTNVTRTLEPEDFANYEVGAKWDVANRLAVTAAAYRLDRTHTRAPNPNDPTRTVLTGSQRTNGFELGVTGRVNSAWQMAGGYANQHALIRSTTAAAAAGATVPLVPRTTLSLWNMYQFTPVLGAALGVVHRTAMYAGVDNQVLLPGFTEADGAVFVSLGRRMQVQLNMENLFNTTYHVTAHSNDNITPGTPRSILLGLTTMF